MRFPQSLSEATALVVFLIHGRLGLEEPLDNRIMAVYRCKVQWCVASGATARGQAAGRTEWKERKKVLRKFWRLKSRNLDIRNILVLRCLEAFEFLGKQSQPG